LNQQAQPAGFPASDFTMATTLCKVTGQHFGLQDQLRAGEIMALPPFADPFLRIDVLTI
jgi:hypothetical protein